MTYAMFQRSMSLLAGGLAILGFVPYIAAILRRETKPAKATWFIWASVDTIILAGMFAESALNGQIVGAVTGVWIVFALALKRGTPGWTTLDKFCLGGAAIGIVLWKSLDNPSFGIVISCLVVFAGAFPTFASAWADPSHENRSAWVIYLASCIAALIGVPVWDIANAVQPITFFAVSATMMFILCAPRRTR